ncbi:DUF7167 family protein [Micromonospora sediminicola]|uniref:DUF7167 family protein n=1 Tax=Micromonospora sediminicola TaxID=946078 RepID=UPI0037A38E2F
MTRRTDPVIIELNCEANPSTDTVEIDRAEWNAMTPGERAAMIDAMVDEHIGNSGGAGWHIDDENDYATVGTAPAKIPLPLADNNAALEAVSAWLADPRSPSGDVDTSARHLLARLDAALAGKKP